MVYLFCRYVFGVHLFLIYLSFVAQIQPRSYNARFLPEAQHAWL
jgi:hypothetical protein